MILTITGDRPACFDEIPGPDLLHIDIRIDPIRFR